MLTKSILAAALILGASSAAFAEQSDGTHSYNMYDRSAMTSRATQWNTGRDSFASAAVIRSAPAGWNSFEQGSALKN